VRLGTWNRDALANTPSNRIEREEILLPHVAPAVGARHRGEPRRAFESDRDMAARRQGLEVAAGPAAEVEQREGRRPLDVLQQRRDVLAHVMVARALPELLGPPVVIFQRAGARFLRILQIADHGLHSPSKRTSAFARIAAGDTANFPCKRFL
jgi:hypothetical protein